MISRSHRFHGQKDLLRVYRRGQTYRQGPCALKISYNQNGAGYRLAVVVSKKVSKSAVARNRIRRRIFEAVRRQEQLISGTPDIVITVFSDQLKELPAQEIERLVAGLLKKTAADGKIP
jgi:ribonuclease P protein component